MKEILKKFIRNNGGSVMFTLKCREREDIFGDIYNDVEDMFYQYADDPSNTCGPEYLQGYLIEVLVTEDEITYTAGVTQQEVNNQPAWLIDNIDDTQEEYLAELYNFLKSATSL